MPRYRHGRVPNWGRGALNGRACGVDYGRNPSRPDPTGVGRAVEAAVIDFEATHAWELSRILIMAAGWSPARFRSQVVHRLLDQGECALADVISTLAEATGAGEVHLFARWLPDESTSAILADRGVRVLAHPLEAIGQASLVSGQRVERWPLPVRAA